MKRSGFGAAVGFVLVTAWAATAMAASLTVTTNKTTYLVGEMVTVTVTGDSQGGSDDAIDGTLLYSSTLTDTPTAPLQSLLLSGAVPWVPGVESFSDGSAEMFDQSRGGI